MTMDRDDTVRRALQELRSADERQAPEFDAVLSRPRVPVQFNTMRIASSVLAAGVVIAAATAVARQASKPPRLVVPQEVIALSSWRPMTDALLEGLPEPIGDSPLTAPSFPMIRRDTAKERTP